MKTCTKCKEIKPLTEFYVHAKGKRPGLYSARCKTCEADRMREYYRKNKDKKNAWSAKRYREIKDQVFNAYGGYVCACCGETEPMFLTIDHINNNGSKHRKEITNGCKDYRDYRSSTGYKTYRWLINHNFPDGFQVLCANCNSGKHRNNGICPHHDSEGSTTIPEGSTAKRLEARSIH